MRDRYSRVLYAIFFCSAAASCARIIKEVPKNEVEFIAFDELEIDSSESVAALIRAGNYDDVELRILDSGPPLSNGPRCGVYNCIYIQFVRLVRFNGSYSTSEITEHLRARGLRPANAAELVVFGNQNPQAQLRYPIVALGSVWQTMEGDAYVAVLGGERGSRSAYMHWSVERWPSCYRFLATREYRH